ncbi:TFC3 [Cyberlindnera jadinii]|uniref:TFC3 protein n=1 Tax=Cyberlindnera jadinii (strain ATCC 18201 / CBS 1600 / BCRC 20928 / JCM 3617 / NBRC 0987 / NRRL Y-1542) TaxID=983966 RepID=A0A0H5C1B0_CYBJN|nr:TFC3 [Cyberlindnera jadinii]
MSLYPDAIVDQVLQELAYENTDGVNWDRVWSIVSQKHPIDDLYKNLIYQWLKGNPNVEHLDASGNPLKDVPDDIQSNNGLIRLKRDYLWVALTGAPERNNPIQASAFQLLCAIGQARSEGIESTELIKVTKQDKRSLTQRVKRIQHLIKKVPIVKGGRSLQWFILLKFFDETRLNEFSIQTKDNTLTTQPQELRERIVKILKDAKAGLRQVLDLRRELEMDKTPRLCIAFKSTINYLKDKGYISKVIVMSPESPTVKIRAVKYLKDYIRKGDNDENDIFDDDLDDGNEDVEDQLKETEDDYNQTTLKSIADAQVIDSAMIESDVPLFNRFYPFQSQIYEMVNKGGTTGLSANELQNQLFGMEYTRLFSRFMDHYTSGTFTTTLANYGIVRHYDFHGRVKFYRYLTRPNLLRLSSQPEDNLGSSLPKLTLPVHSLTELNESLFYPLVSNPSVKVIDGVPKVHWVSTEDDASGNIDSEPTRKRSHTKDKGDTSTKKQKKTQLPPLPETTKEIQVIGDTKDNPLVISNIQGMSFKAIERQACMLRVLEDHQGIMENGFSFRDEVNSEMGFIIDKKTSTRDTASLIEQKKLLVEKFTLENGTSVELLISPYASQETIESFKRVLGTSIVDKKHHMGSNYEHVEADIDFFDMELRDSLLAPSQRSKQSTQPHSTGLVGSNKAKVVKPKSLKKKNVDQVKQKLAEVKHHGDDSVASNPGKDRRDSLEDWLHNKRKRTPFEKVESDSKLGRKRRSAQLDSESMMYLFKAVIICKTLTENQIDWVKISELEQFEGILPGELRSRWPKVRMMMGPTGIKVARRTWRKILLDGLKDKRIPMSAVEDLDIETMISFWNNDVVPGDVSTENTEKLFVDLDENFRHYNFVKSNATGAVSGQYDSNSMVQRENYLVNQVFTYTDKDDPLDTHLSKEDIIRNVIIAIIASGQNFELKSLDVLKQFTTEDIDSVFLKMTKSREIVVSSDSKAILGERLNAVLTDHSYDFSMGKVAKFQQVLKELCQHDKGLILDPIFDNSCMVSILELIKDNAVNVTRVDHYRKEILNGYEARLLERDKLDCDIILSKGASEIRGLPVKSIPVPHGSPCSRIWIDLGGQINKAIWTKILRATLVTILSNPGITFTGIYDAIGALLCVEDAQLVLQWLADSRAIRLGEMDGYWLEPEWYMVV